MKKAYSFVLASLLATAVLSTPTPNDLNEGLQVQQNTPGLFTLSWWGKANRTYFIQQSEDLINWHYIPLIESGEEDVISWGFSSNADRLFFKLRMSDQPTNGNPNTADFDGDGLSNLDELQHGLDPFNTTEGPPVAASLSVETLEDTAVGLPLDTVSRPSTGTITYEIVSAPLIGRIENEGGTFQYIPHAHVHGIETFSYRAVYNGTIPGPTATATVNIAPVNDPPLVYAGPNTNATVGVPLPLQGQITDVDTATQGMLIEWRVEQALQGGSVVFSAPQSLNSQATFTHTGEYVLRLTAIDGVAARADLMLVNVVDAETAIATVTWNSPELQSTAVSAQSQVTFEVTIDAGTQTIQDVHLLRGSQMVGAMEAVVGQAGRFRYVLNTLPYGVHDFTVRLVTTSGQTALSGVRRVTATLQGWTNDPTPGNGTGNPNGGNGGVNPGDPIPQGGNGGLPNPSNPAPQNNPNPDTDGDGIPDALDAAPNDPLIRWARAPESLYIVIPLGVDWTPIALNDEGVVVGMSPNSYGIWKDEAWTLLPNETQLLDTDTGGQPITGLLNWVAGIDNDGTVYGEVINTHYLDGRGVVKFPINSTDWQLLEDEKLVEIIGDPDATPANWQMIIRNHYIQNITLNGKTSEYTSILEAVTVGENYEENRTSHSRVNEYLFEDKSSSVVTRSGYSVIYDDTATSLLKPDGSVESFTNIGGEFSPVEAPPQGGSSEPGTPVLMRRSSVNSSEVKMYIKLGGEFVPSTQPFLSGPYWEVAQGRMNSQGVAMVPYGSNIWRNGEVIPMSNLVSGDWGQFTLIDINNKGTIAGTATPVTARDQNGNPTSFGTRQAVLLVPIEITWEKIGDSWDIEDNQDSEGNWMPGKGKKFFPDAKTPVDQTPRDLVNLRVKTGALEGSTVHLKVFDVDDPTPTEDDPEHVIDPNDEGVEKGGDNRGRVSATQSAIFIGGGTPDSIACIIDSQGIGKVGGQLPTLRLGVQPGDNFRVAAVVGDVAPLNGLQVQNKNAAGYVASGEGVVKTFNGVLSPMLTIWRKLHIEIDSMPAVPTSGDQKNFEEGNVTAVSVDGKTVTLDIRLTGPEDRYEDGHLTVAGSAYRIEFNTDNLINGDQLTMKDAVPASAVGQSFTIRDDDDNYLSELGLPSSLPQNQNHKAITDVIRPKFAPAYIQIEDAAALGYNVGASQVLPFKLNENALSAFGTVWDDKKDLNSSNGFWAITVAMGYQFETGADRDPDGENAPAAMNVKNSEAFGRVLYCAIPMEHIREYTLTPVAQNPYIIGSPALRQQYHDEYIGFLYGTIAHEIGHGPGGADEDGNHNEGGLMRDGGGDITLDFSAETINRFRNALDWSN